MFWPLFSFFFYLFLFPCVPARTLRESSLSELTVDNDHLHHDPENIIDNTWHNFMRLLDVEKGSHVSGMSELKKYFQRFGYLGGNQNNFTNLFDEDLESALLTYQNNLGLTATGKLDNDTVHQIMAPRCGVSDTTTTTHSLHAKIHYAYFYGQPRWTKGSSPITLTYAFSSGNMIDYITLPEIKSVFERSFSRWSSVIPVNFTEAKHYSQADIKIGFYRGDHGDGEAFDGVLGVLAHAFSPENGRFHLDAAETWAVDFKEEKSKVAVDLESVATHEIGHILGLAHSSVKEAVMYPSLSPRYKKVDLKIDDVEGIQALYGSNPNFKFTSLYESDISSSRSLLVEIQSGDHLFFFMVVVFFFFFLVV